MPLQYLPDPYKIDVLKFLDSAPGKAFIEVLRARCPEAPDANLPHSTKLSRYDQRAGAEFILREMVEIPHQSQQPDALKAQREAVLLDPRD